MYSIGFRDRVERLTDIPESDFGAPRPVVIADEHRVLLAYFVAESDPSWKGTDEGAISSPAEGMIAIVTFDGASLHMFGPPNDEAFGGHPLAKRGLRPHSANEIHNSSWLKLRIRMNRVHPRHDDSLFAGLRHFVFAFHDSTFECLASAFSVTLFRGSIAAAIEQMGAKLAPRSCR